MNLHDMSMIPEPEKGGQVAILILLRHNNNNHHHNLRIRMDLLNLP
jgi:hypothetical protein